MVGKPRSEFRGSEKTYENEEECAIWDIVCKAEIGT